MAGKEPSDTRGVVVSVNLARMRQVPMGDLLYDTGIWKFPVDHRVAARELGLEGDKQGDPNVHGGPLKAVYAYAGEDIRWWEQQLGRRIEPGSFGENLTLSGVAVTGALIGERWRIGTAELLVTQPRQPCWKLGIRMEDQKLPHRFSEANRPGAYLSVVKEGQLAKGDAVEVIKRPAHPVTIGLLAYLIYTDHRLASLVMEKIDEELTSAEWRDFLKAKLAS
ncbi:MAG TPA: MOSC domain-containing protein [Actinomycetota bacterium]|nr:MOSC domain-containing protein [Actinomycetota bacterium]